MGFWFWFYASGVAITLAHSHFPIMPGRMRHHTFGAEIIAASWIAGGLMRWILGDETPLVGYASIDVLAAIAFFFVARRNQAAWAAICVILHAVMCCLHLAFFITGEENTLGYITILNGLFLTSLLVVNFAILAGRHAWGRHVDRIRIPFMRGYNFSGVRDRRFQHYRKEGR